jgi:hypothetical protein
MYKRPAYISMPLASVNLTGLVPDTQLRRPMADRVLMPLPTPTIFNLPK